MVARLYIYDMDFKAFLHQAIVANPAQKLKLKTTFHFLA
jgi:hypothetical protein